MGMKREALIAAVLVVGWLVVFVGGCALLLLLLTSQE